ncbi:MAG: hypothetical protein WC951_08220 [Bacteroidales bacterium]
MKVLNILSALTLGCFLSANIAVGQNLEEQQTAEPIAENAYNRLIVSVNAGYSLNSYGKSPVSSIPEWSKNMGSGIVPSLNLTYLFTKNLGAGLGFKYTSSSTGYTVKGFGVELETLFIDQDDSFKSYYPIYENVNITETNYFRGFDIPVYAYYQNSVSVLNYFVTAGFMYSSITETSYRLDGTLTRKGRYPDVNAVLENYPEYNYGDLVYTNSDLSKPIPGVKQAFSLMLGVGVSYEVVQNIAVKVGVTGVYGLSNISEPLPNTFNTFHTSTISNLSTTLNSIVFEVGVSYSFLSK